MSSQELTVAVSEEAGERLDVFLAKKTGITRSRVQKLIMQKAVLVNERVQSSNYRVRPDDSISVAIEDEEPSALVPEAIPLEILYEDEHLVFVNKPPGIVVYPAAGHSSGTLMNALAFHCGKLAAPGGPLRPGVVHRLDKDTSGVMVVALDDKAYYSLVEQFRQRTISRKYVALVYGDMKEDSGEISLRIGRSESDRKKMSTHVRKGKDAFTRWKVLRRFGIATLIEVRLGTGRTHQIRVHFASIGHPVLGDQVYGRKVAIELKGRKISFPRQMLHAELLGFTHPVTGAYIEFSSHPPEDMNTKIDEFENI
ncbi:MAG TPA: RluA family pseudouridine synthase [Thermodesulfovibrionales bacterium]|nr:RluA family pseudouridine synthase [Thermodesulfovibrionales bacterium]